jgi:hypothetical protein
MILLNKLMKINYLVIINESFYRKNILFNILSKIYRKIFHELEKNLN